MTSTASSPALGVASPSLPARLVGVLFSPRATYAAVAARPAWFGALAAVILVASLGVFALLSTEIGREAWLDAAVQQQESYGRRLTDDQYDRMERMAPYSPYLGVAFQIVVVPISALVIAGLAFAVFSAMLGADGTFKQVFAVVTHSGAVLVAAQLFGLPLAYARRSMSSPTNLGVFAPFLDEASFPARLLGAIDLMFIWWAISLAIGLGVLYRRRTAPIATTLLAIYGAIGLVIAIIKTMASGA
jgi:hypothetical protein